MKHYIFDIDGTISQGGKKVECEICQAIEALAQHNQIFFASARPVRDMLPMIDESLHTQATFIGCNGGMAYKNGEFLFSHTIEAQDVETILTFLKQNQIPYVLDGVWHFAFSENTHPFHDYIRSLSQAEKPEAELINEGITKILILSSNHKSELLASINPKLSVHNHTQEEIYDITPSGNNKFFTIQRLIGDLPYTAFGNDQNDFLMLENAQTAVFLGQEAVFPQADYYLTTEQIADFLQQYIKK